MIFVNTIKIEPSLVRVYWIESFCFKWKYCCRFVNRSYRSSVLNSIWNKLFQLPIGKDSHQFYSILYYFSFIWLKVFNDIKWSSESIYLYLIITAMDIIPHIIHIWWIFACVNINGPKINVGVPFYYWV